MSTTFFEAALQVLKSTGRPLTTREITALAIETGLITPVGKTPAATMSAALYRYGRGHAELAKLEVPVNGRAKRGSVRWALRDASSASYR